MQPCNLPDHLDRRVPALGTLLQAGRQSAGLSQTALSRLSGVSRQQIARLERGEIQNPTPRVVTRLAHTLDMSPIDLLVLDGHVLPGDLPGFRAYLLAKHPNCPEAALYALDEFYGFIKDKYGLDEQA